MSLILYWLYLTGYLTTYDTWTWWIEWSNSLALGNVLFVWIRIKSSCLHITIWLD